MNAISRPPLPLYSFISSLKRTEETGKKLL